jgi:type I restriction enzyme S subunit
LQAVDLPSFDTGSSNPTINRNRLHPYKVAIPPHSEQLDIVKMLDLEADRFDSIRGEVHHMVNVLKERRSALISAAVTGQIDVRGLATKEEP